MPVPIRTVQVSDADRTALQRLVRTRTTAQRVVERARIVLASANGLRDQEIRAAVGVSPPTVMRWLNRFESHGVVGLLQDRPRSGRPKRISAAREDAVQIRRLAVTSVEALISAITAYIDARNRNSKPFTWTASVQHILAKVEKAERTLEARHQPHSTWLRASSCLRLSTPAGPFPGFPIGEPG